MCSRTVLIIRKYSSQKSVSYFTTPIYYVNANPHIGHLYSSVIADAAQRWKHISNRNLKIKFATGTDEHGTKIQQAAEKNETSLSDYCANLSSKYKLLSDHFSIQYTDFIRTTDDKHKKAVHKFWKKLQENGHIYNSTYKGWYCVSDESFLTESQLKEHLTSDGRKIIVSAESGHPVEWTEEENYMFKLGAFKDDLKHWLRTNENFVKPSKFHKILQDQVSSLEHDVSVSRPSSRVHWGIRVPDDDSQSIYVWLDALVNYLTVAGYGSDDNAEFTRVWPADVQVIGKDILKFHGIYWPAFLMAAGLEPPRTILCHSHWTVDGEKMSKSKGNVVCPFDRSNLYTSDGMRYFLLREGVAHSDGNYSDTKVVRILNSELADTLGNLLSRCCGTAVNSRQVFPEIELAAWATLNALDVTKKLMENVAALPEICDMHFKDFNFYKASDSIVATLHSANLFFETLKPWELAKRPEKIHELNAVLHLAMETLRVAGILLQPLIPNMANELLNKLAIPGEKRLLQDAKSLSWERNDFKEVQLIPEKVVLFRRIITEGAKVKSAKKG